MPPWRTASRGTCNPGVPRQEGHANLAYRVKHFARIVPGLAADIVEPKGWRRARIARWSVLSQLNGRSGLPARQLPDGGGKRPETRTPDTTHSLLLVSHTL